MARILIADDEELIRGFIRRVLEQDEHTVLEATNGNEVIRTLENETIDLLILDLVMPGKGGMETLRELKANHVELKIIVMTGQIEIDQHFFTESIKVLGSHRVLKKPIAMDRLRDEVRKVLYE